MRNGRRFLTVATAVLASLLEILDVSIVNVAIPRMQGNLGVTLQEITWIATGYIISNAVVLPIASWLGERIGRRTYFTGCILLFTIASLLCGIAPNFAALVIFRVIQGAAGGALLPTSQTLIQEQFVGPQAGMGSAIYGMSVMIGPALGPTLGGYLTDNYGWRSIFFINVPVGIFAAVLAMLVIEEPEHTQATSRERGKIDLLGFTLLVLGIGSLQFLLERGQAEDWFSSSLIIAAVAVAGICLPLFYAYEYLHPDPIVDVRLFSETSVRYGTLLMAATGMVLFSLVFLIPVYTDQILQMDATQTGLLYVPSSLATMAIMPIIGNLLSRIGPRPLISVGTTLIAICLYMFSHFTTQVGYWDLFWPLMVRGIGLGCLFVPINTAVLSQFKGKQLGQAAGLLNLFRQLGGSIGIAGISTLLDRLSSQIRGDLRTVVSAGRSSALSVLQQTQAGLSSKFTELQGLSQGSLGYGEAATGALKSLQGRMEMQAFQLSFNRIMIIVLALYLFSFIAVFRLKLKQRVTGPVAME